MTSKTLCHPEQSEGSQLKVMCGYFCLFAGGRPPEADAPAFIEGVRPVFLPFSRDGECGLFAGGLFYCLQDAHRS